jgi:hypothetical protein
MADITITYYQEISIVMGRRKTVPRDRVRCAGG